MRKSEWRSFIRRAEPTLAAYALPMPRIFFGDRVTCMYSLTSWPARGYVPACPDGAPRLPACR
eukprot:3736735-Prymnesium_polylepis.1